MARKGKGKSKKATDPVVVQKLEKLQVLRDCFREQANEYEAYMNRECTVICEKIQKMYMDRLKTIPEHIRNMTVQELMELDKGKNSPENIVGNLELKRLQFEKNFDKTKVMSEKKKSRKISRIERKRSLSASSCASSKAKSIIKSSDAAPSLTRMLSDSCLNTPTSKKSVLPQLYVTPKFNPKIPVNKSLLRQPRIGEILMSTSGSPVQNLVDDLGVKPGIAVSLGDGKVIKIAEDSEVFELQNRLKKFEDEGLDKNLENCKKILDKILKS